MKLYIAYLNDGSRLIIKTVDEWIVLHPEDGSIIASDSESECVDLVEIQTAFDEPEWDVLIPTHISPGMLESISYAFFPKASSADLNPSVTYCIGCGEWFDTWNGFGDERGDFWCEKCYCDEMGEELARLGLSHGISFRVTKDTMSVEFWKTDHLGNQISPAKEYDLGGYPIPSEV